MVRPRRQEEPVSDRSAIEWTEATWNPTTGCDRVSVGCDNCYALTLAKRLKAMGAAKNALSPTPSTLECTSCPTQTRRPRTATATRPGPGPTARYCRRSTPASMSRPSVTLCAPPSPSATPAVPERWSADIWMLR
ncbi:DUF5131 family protein [Streptomyces olivaceiscleroticus]|uniref:DUF5131 family protein n=1 Tax=Streptomyces olivaceiscleroticus TaxID=68245 RepID=UPI003D15C81A